MPPPLLVDLSAIDLNNVVYDAQAIETVNPHRFEMRQLDAIVHLDLEAGTIVGYKDTAQDDALPPSQHTLRRCSTDISRTQKKTGFQAGKPH